MSKIIIIIGSFLLSGAYLFISHLLHTEVKEITEKIQSAISLNSYDDHCTITGNDKALNICGQKINLRVARINNEVAVIYQGGFPDEPDLMIVTSDFTFDQYCILLDGIIRWGTYNVDGCNQILETD
ncbi:hypothetical protein A5482_015105 (plasmid) [Cyanobacterium sp. IPPAS B-1200]|uniref:hypothetical protein n=1 Tax=Cyanobacterium sp. IPPAS B-1200 TaxID=1562720 RepID=UPI000852742A|nr:hypothetical protein [Cyanobacterium sp. IPPAS B-1200]OEJ78108.1 hypothetical protein A5482_14120 [Cyanobacterium sp. IPPAS B-1200]